MSAYVIVEIKVHDTANYEEYRPLAAASVARHGGRCVAAAGTPRPSKGTGRDGSSSSNSKTSRPPGSGTTPRLPRDAPHPAADVPRPHDRRRRDRGTDGVIVRRCISLGNTSGNAAGQPWYPGRGYSIGPAREDSRRVCHLGHQPNPKLRSSPAGESMCLN